MDANNLNNRNYGDLQREAADLITLQRYDQAFEKYNTLIAINPNDAVNYGGRAACYEKMGNWTKAFEDSKKSIELDPTFVAGHCQVIQCALRLHQFFDMERSVDKLREIDPANEVLGYQSGKMNALDRHLANLKNAKAAKNDMKALEHIEKCLEICPGLIMYKVKKAECLASLRSFGEAAVLANEVLQQDSNNSEAHYILARCLYETDVERSVHHFNESFRLNPLCDKDREFYLKAKRFLEKTAAANNAYNQQNFAQAYELCRGMLEEGQKNEVMMVTLLSMMAEASYKLGDIDRCLQKCAAVFSLKPDHLKALILRAQCHRDQGNFAESIADLETALRINPSAEIVGMLEEAQRLWEPGNDGARIWGLSMVLLPSLQVRGLHRVL